MSETSPQPVIDLIDAFRASKAMFAAVTLGVFDRLEAGHASNKQLAQSLQCGEGSLEQLLDACAGLGLLEKRCGMYRNLPVASEYLTQASEKTLVGYVRYSNEVSYKLWDHLEEAVQQGGNQWQRLHGDVGGIFDAFFKTEGAAKDFLGGMHGFGLISSPKVVAAFDLSPYRQMVDVGGATGHLAIAACERYPELHATVFDLPNVIESAGRWAKQSAVADRVTMLAGDMFADGALPEGDLFSLGRILHDWDDARCVALLKSVYQKLPEGGAVLLAEKLLAEDKSGPLTAQLQSLNMLVCTEGKERTLSEFRTLLEAAGFCDVAGKVTGAPLDGVFAAKRRC